MNVNRASEARIDVGRPFGDPIPQTFNTVAIGCLEDWLAPDQVPGGIEPGDSVLESCGVPSCDRTKEFNLDAEQEMKIVCSGICKKGQEESLGK